MTQVIQIHPWLPSVGSSLGYVRLLHKLRRPRLGGAAAAALAARSASRPSTLDGAAPCRHACRHGGCAEAAAPGQGGKPRNRAGSPTAPPLGTPYTLSHTLGRSIAPIHRSLVRHAGRTASAKSPVSSVLGA